VGAALAAVTAVLLLAWMPWNLGLLMRGLIGMVVGAEIERRTTPNGAPPRRAAS
jgi:hypothetical protein